MKEDLSFNIWFLLFKRCFFLSMVSIMPLNYVSEMDRV